MGEIDGNISATALKALAVLDFMGEQGRALSVMDVAQGVGVDRATAYRMLLTLVQAGYVLRDDKTYRLSFKLLSLARHLVHDNERSLQITQCLKQICEETGETVHYSALDQDNAVLVFRVKGIQRVSVDFQIGDRSPLACTSIGKVLLAYSSVEFQEKIIAQGLVKTGPKTIIEPKALREEFVKVRQQRYAIDDLEFAPDMRCLALPVFERGMSVPGGVAISGPSSRFDLEKLQQLRACAEPHVAELSRKLGGFW